MEKARRQPDLWPSTYKMGMWVWVLHRLTGLYLIGYGAFHLLEIALSLVGVEAFDWFFGQGYSPLMQFLDLGLMTALFYHSLNGLRVILLDLGIGVKRHKALFAGIMSAGFVLYAYVAWEILPYILGRSLL